MILLALLVVLSLWLLEDGGQPTGDGDVARVGEATAVQDSGLEGLAPGPAEALPVADDDAAEAEAVGFSVERLAELADSYPATELRGRLVLTEGGRLPEAISVVGRTRTPHPRVRSLSLSQIRELDGQSSFVAVGDDELAALTRTAVDADGRFVMQGAPAEGSFWLGVESDAVYQHAQLPVSVPEDGGELIVEVTWGATLGGRVVDADGVAVPLLEVSAHSAMDPYAMIDGSSTIAELADATTDGQGRFRFAPVPIGVALVLTTASEHGFQSLTAKVPALATGEHHELELVVQRGGTLSGRVVDLDDEPVPATRLRLQPTRLNMTDMDTMGMVDIDMSAVTDEDGRFVFDGLSSGAYKLALVGSRYLTVSHGPFEVATGATLEDLRVVADPGLAVSGRVVDQHGEVLPGVEVSGSLPPDLLSMRARTDRMLRDWVTTDDEGRFSISGFEQGDVRLRARSDGFTGASLDVAAGADDVQLMLWRTTSIRGIALDLSTGDPLTEYTLRLQPAEDLGFGDLLDLEERFRDLPPPLHVQDDEGRFEMPGISAGTYDLVLTSEGHARTVVDDIGVDADEGASGVILMVPEEARVIGQVLSGRDGAALAGVTVTTGRTDAMGMWTSMLNGPVPQTLTDAQGFFELGGLGAEPVALSFKHADHEAHGLPELALSAGEIHDLGPVTLPPGATIWGFVRDADGRPEEGVAVLISDPRGSQMRRVTADTEGRYEAHGFKPGTLNVMRLDMSFSFDSDNPMSALDDMVFETVTVAQDERKRVDLGRDDSSGCRLSGRVAGAAGPEPDAMVILVREEGAPGTRFGSSDEDGLYAFTGVQPGRYLLQVIPSGSMAAGGSQPSSPVLETLTVGDQREQRHDVSVPGGALHGEVRAARDGRRLAGVRVLLERTDDGRPASRFLDRMGGRVGEAYTDGEGGFSFRHLPTGTYAVVAGGTNMLGLGESGWAAERVEDLAVREGSEGFSVTVELDPGCGIRGVVTDRDGKPLEGVPVWARNDRTGRWLSLLSEVSTDGAGRYELNSLEQGTWTLAFGGDRWALEIVEGVRTQRDRMHEEDVRLRRGVEVLARLGERAAGRWSVRLNGPTGAVPTELASMEGLLSGGAREGLRRLGRVRPGSYGVEVWLDGELAWQTTLGVRQDDDPLIVEMPAEDG